MFPPLKHAEWHGLTPTDLVFPFFLFAVGNALAFVMPKFKAQPPAYFWKKVIKRSVLIFAIGLFLNWWPFVRWNDDVLVFRHWVNPDNPESGVRIFGVLQRIAVCYFFAAILAYYLPAKKLLLTSLGILMLYWILCMAGNPADPYSLKGWFGTGIDKAVLGIAHMYKGEGIPFDPEGLMSTLPAITQVLLGFLTGQYIQQHNIATTELQNTPSPFYKMLTGMFIIATGLLVTSYCWHLVFPVNKKIWTSSYVLATTGLAIITIATMIYYIEGKKVKNFITRFFDAFGKNPLFVFALSAFLPKGLGLIKLGDGVNPWNFMYKKVYQHIPGDPRIGSLLFALTVITFMWLICYWLDKKKIYIKV